MGLEGGEESPSALKDNATGAIGADVEKFWAALGEIPEGSITQLAMAPKNASAPEDFLRRPGDAFRAIMPRGSQGSQQSLDDVYPIL
ncbi:hypothetical protein VTJ49DRAFT_6592 [Mycothermus thermophilus]|uniref:Uncharacterized protein n=1 Tax=Humicola insolens TaxID=85995 RepID=A0ABR3V154_HUMIN